MTAEELRSKIKSLVKIAYQERSKAEKNLSEYDELTKFPELKQAIIDLLTTDFDKFLASIDWVSPKPTTFRINLKNGFDFYLIYSKRSWSAQIEGKKYYLLNKSEEGRAAEAVARILRYGEKEDLEAVDEDGGGDFQTEEPSPDGSEDITVEV